MSYSEHACPLWHRYSDGAWPLLAGRRALTMELATGHRQQAEMHRGARGFTKAGRPQVGCHRVVPQRLTTRVSVVLLAIAVTLGCEYWNS